MRISDWSSDVCSSDLERLQTVPVSVTAFSSAALQQANVRDLQDLTVVTPGLHFGYVGGKNTTSVLMRGLGNLPVGAGTPAVVAYLNNVPLPAVGTNIPTYDIANVQVLKGPQERCSDAIRWAARSW